MKTLLSILENRSENTMLALSIILIFFLVSLFVFFNNPTIFFPLFIIPVLLVSWYGGSKAGILLSVFSVCLILVINFYIIPKHIDTHLLIYSSISLFISCILAAVLVTNFQKVHKVEVIAAGTDNLTGAANTRAFHIELANEILRSVRYKHIFTLAYIDIDNFKYINDTYGHTIGDDLLIQVVKHLKSSLRQTDVIARIGGDEFACLFPETSLEEAKTAFSKASDLLRIEMQNKKWPVTFSVGIVTFETLPDDLKQAMKVADDLMYTVKNSDKNNVAYSIWQGIT